jgi:hypothetical protein
MRQYDRSLWCNCRMMFRMGNPKELEEPSGTICLCSTNFVCSYLGFKPRLRDEWSPSNHLNCGTSSKLTRAP